MLKKAASLRQGYGRQASGILCKRKTYLGIGKVFPVAAASHAASPWHHWQMMRPKRAR